MKVLRTMIVVAVLVLAMCMPSIAAITEPIITSTKVDTAAMVLLIEGFNLPNGAVYMGKDGGGATKLHITQASSTGIEAQLKTTEPGTYIVAIVMSADQFWTSTVTIGRSLASLDARYIRHEGSPLRAVSGWVRNDGVILAGEGFTVTNDWYGAYTITFNKPFSGVPIPVISPTSDAHVDFLTMESNKIQILLSQASGSPAVERNFSFIFLGVD